MIVRSKAGQARTFRGVSFDVLATGDKAMVTRMNFTTGQAVPRHQHPHEQIGYVLSGRYRLTVGPATETLESGDTYCVPGGVEHALEVIEAGQIVDFFTPPREDYL